MILYPQRRRKLSSFPFSCLGSSQSQSLCIWLHSSQKHGGFAAGSFFRLFGILYINRYIYLVQKNNACLDQPISDTACVSRLFLSLSSRPQQIQTWQIWERSHSGKRRLKLAWHLLVGHMRTSHGYGCLWRRENAAPSSEMHDCSFHFPAPQPRPSHATLSTQPGPKACFSYQEKAQKLPTLRHGQQHSPWGPTKAWPSLSSGGTLQWARRTQITPWPYWKRKKNTSQN